MNVMFTDTFYDYEFDTRWELMREWMEEDEGLTEEESLDALCPEDETPQYWKDAEEGAWEHAQMGAGWK